MEAPHDEKTPGLPILATPTHLFEKIIRKLKHKSYARLQMTCKSMAKFAQTTTVIPKYEHIDARVAWHKGRDKPWLADSDKTPLIPFNNKPPVKETRYKKIRIYGPDFISQSGLDISILLKFLEKNRISCVELYVTAYEDEFFLSSDDWLTLLGILKPEKVIAQSDYRHLIDIFINYPNQLTEVGLGGRSDEVKKVLARIKSVSNILPMCNHYWMDDYKEFHPLSKKIIEFLDSDYAKNLREFKYIFNLAFGYCFDRNQKRITSTEVTSNFSEFAPATENPNAETETVKFLLRHGTCSVHLLRGNDHEIHYRKTI